MKTSLLCVALALLLLPVKGICNDNGPKAGESHTATFRFVAGDDMFYSPWGGNGDELERLYALVDRYRADITSGAMPVCVNGYCSSGDEVQANFRMAVTRSNRVKSELIIHKGLSEGNFITKNHATAYTTPDGKVHRDMVVVTLRIPAKPEPAPQPKPEPAPRPEPAPKPEPTPEPQPEPVVETPPVEIEPLAPARDRHAGFYVRTNLLYDAMLTPTIGLEWRVNDNVGIKLDGSWSHWGSETGRTQKMWLVSPEVRWYLLENKRFYVGLGANIGEANIYKGLANVLSKDTGYQGSIYGGGITVGYNLWLNGCLSMDFNLGLGVTHFKYDTFTVTNDVRVYKGRDLTKNWWGPSQAGISLVWKIGRAKDGRTH